LTRRRAHAAVLAATLLAAHGAAAQDAKPAARWLVGDLHVHVSPPDAPGHSALTVETAVAEARKRSLDFLVLTPHDVDASYAGLVKRTAASTSATETDGTPRPIVVVAGWEFTRETPGHLGVSFVDAASLADVADDKKAATAMSRGGLVVVNHPFFRPVASDLPVMKRLTGDRGWGPFLGEGKDDLAWNGIEIWHERSVLVQRLHATRADKFPETQMVSDALRAWDKATREQRRRIVAVGGSDCHGHLPYALVPMPMVSVRVDSFDEEGLKKGLLAAHATFGEKGGAAARDFAATSDVAGAAASIGDSLAAKSEVRLTWTGKASLVEDGVKVGEFDGGAVRKIEPPGAFRSWRIEAPGDAYSNCIYANLP
jgi:hypothetical protein